MSYLDKLPPTQPDPAFSIVAAYEAYAYEKKVGLCPGFYRDENAKPWILHSVAQAKERIHANPSLNHEHLPLTGHPGLLRGAQELAFGTTRDLKRVASIQTVSGTGSNHIAAVFLSSRLEPKTVWISNPSWINHTEVWKLAGPDVQQRFYPYFDAENFKVNFEGMTETLRKDARKGDWKIVADICREVGLFAVFDMAYQGFASGDLEQDAFAITHFYDTLDMEFAIAQSFSKKFGLYGDRVGVPHVVAPDAKTVENTTPLLTQISRAEITSCPSYGARIVAEILGDSSLFKQWLKDLVEMSERMKSMRLSLYQGLERRKVQGSWEHLLSDIGMFSMTRLSRAQVAELREKHHIYLLPSGRLSVTGLTSKNVETVAAALHDILGSE
ncbi:hypothetical protein CEP54_007029 [Fusarium duplospermum]|uniref:Aspartate aminotransferase n=1 Tax=Fusarium duplospermum TaxID=1325734 RepID=A0A428Q3Q7_9HYPO|nr:hypothetical protein CEP54_007029 [Fusarium duplospermum]